MLIKGGVICGPSTRAVANGNGPVENGIHRLVEADKNQSIQGAILYE